MYRVNPERPDVEMEVVRTFRYEAENDADPRDGVMCMELASPDKRYRVTCTLEESRSFDVVG